MDYIYTYVHRVKFFVGVYIVFRFITLQHTMNCEYIRYVIPMRIASSSLQCARTCRPCQRLYDLVMRFYYSDWQQNVPKTITV